MSLWQDFLTNDGREIYKWNHYFPIYERHLARFRNLDVNLLEIGVASGGSLQLWRRYLGPFARIVGIDIDPNCAFIEPQIEVRIGDQSDRRFLEQLTMDLGPFDIIIDDGSHKMSDVNASFDVLYPRLNRNGVYLVEDMHTAYWEGWGGGLKAPGSSIERCKDFIDDLNAPARNTPSAFGAATLSMHFYDSVVVIEKGRNRFRKDIVTARGLPFNGTSPGDMKR